MGKYKNVIFTLEQHSPMLIMTRRYANIAESLRYIPGRSFRGAVAAARLRFHGKDDAFVDCFENGSVPFPDIYPVPESGEEISPGPSTLVSCKRFPQDGETGHGFSDMFPAYAAAVVAGQPLPHPPQCPKCGEDQRRLRMYFWSGKPLDSDGDLLVGMKTRISLDRSRKSARDGALFSHQTVSSGSGLWGNSVLMDERDAGRIKAVFDGLPWIVVGHARAAGQGRFTLKAEVRDAKMPDMKQLITEFSGRFVKQYGIKDDGLYVPLLLKSDAVFLDPWLRYSDRPDPGSIFTLVHSSVDTIRTHGWNSALGLPAEEDIAVTRGSVYLYRISKEDLEVAAGILDGIRLSGVGTRRAEGFGRVSVCDPVHLEHGAKQ